jgi:hypothetical protein
MLSLLSLALASPPLQELPNGQVDWTRGVLIVEASGSPNTGAWSDLGVAEKDAFGQLELRIVDLSARIAFDAERSAGELMGAGDALAVSLAEAQGSWSIAETRYLASGGVEMRAELQLQPWLRAALVAQAQGDGDQRLVDTERSGLVIDARQVGGQPCFAPRLLDPEGQPLYGASTLSAEMAASRVPAVWVGDPAQTEASELAGQSPLFVVAVDADGCDLVLNERDSQTVRALQATAVLAEARVVVVVE